MSLLDEVAKHRKHIKYEALTFSLSELVNMYGAKPKEIEIRPDFQRLFRWSRAQQSAFVESLVLEIPIPPLFFFESDDGKWELLDGLQRLSTILKFMSIEADVPAEHQGEIHNEDDWHYENENDLATPLQLVEGEYLKALSGLTFGRLPTQLQLNLKRSRMHIYVLKRETDRTYKYEVFKRLNTGGAHLEAQELRNCSVRLMDDKFPEFLQEISRTAEFKLCLGFEGEKTKNGYVEELALRFFTMKNYAENFTHDVSEFLTHFMEEVTRGAITFNIEAETKLFKRTWLAIQSAISDGEAFRAKTDDKKSTGSFSPTLFEMVSVGVAQNIDHVETLEAAVLRERIIGLILKAKSENLVGSGTNSAKKTKGRMDLASSWFKKP